MVDVSKQKSSSVIYDLLFSIVIPSLILTKGADYFPNLDAIHIFIIALSFPIIYGIYDQLNNKHFNVISFLGFLNVLLTGGVGLFQASKTVIIIKEAGFPLLIGIMCLVFNKRLQKYVYEQSQHVLNVKKIIAKTSKEYYNNWIAKFSLYFCFPFFLSSLLNGIMTYIIIQSIPGTQAFNEEIAQLLIWGFIGVALPCLICTLAIIFYLIFKLKKETALNLEELFVEMK